MLLCVAVQRCREGEPRGSVAGREHPSRCNLGCSLRLSLSYPFLGLPAASIFGGTRFISLQQLAVIECLYRCCVALSGHSFCR
jgi:hypothetical protein